MQRGCPKRRRAPASRSSRTRASPTSGGASTSPLLAASPCVFAGAEQGCVERADPRDEFGPSFGFAHAVFTPGECDAIVALMEAKATRERDHRPSHGVSRTNYGDADGRRARDELSLIHISEPTSPY